MLSYMSNYNGECDHVIYVHIRYSEVKGMYHMGVVMAVVFVYLPAYLHIGMRVVIVIFVMHATCILILEVHMHYKKEPNTIHNLFVSSGMRR